MAAVANNRSYKWLTKEIEDLEYLEDKTQDQDMTSFWKSKINCSCT